MNSLPPPPPPRQASFLHRPVWIIARGMESTTKLKGSGQFGTVRPKTAVNFRVNGRIREMVLGPSSPLKCLRYGVSCPLSFSLSLGLSVSLVDQDLFFVARPESSRVDFTAREPSPEVFPLSTRIDYLFRTPSPDYKLKSCLAFNREDRARHRFAFPETCFNFQKTRGA